MIISVSVAVANSCKAKDCFLDTALIVNQTNVSSTKIGRSLSLDCTGRYAAVGNVDDDDQAQASADVYRLNTEETDYAPFFHVAKPENVGTTEFGRTVRLSCDHEVLVVADPNALDSGALFVYLLSGDEYNLQQTLTQLNVSEFGTSVSLSCTFKLLAVGSNNNTVFLYQFSDSQHRFVHLHNLDDDNITDFGKTVALTKKDGRLLAVGSTNATVSIYRREGTTYEFLQTVEQPNASTFFSFALALDAFVAAGEVLVVGEPDGLSGKVHVYSGVDFADVALLTPPAPVADFGRSLDISRSVSTDAAYVAVGSTDDGSFLFVSREDEFVFDYDGTAGLDGGKEVALSTRNAVLGTITLGTEIANLKCLNRNTCDSC